YCAAVSTSFSIVVAIISNYPYSNYPYSNYPYSNYPYSNYPYSNYPYSNYPYSNYPYSNYPSRNKTPVGRSLVLIAGASSRLFVLVFAFNRLVVLERA